MTLDELHEFLERHKRAEEAKGAPMFMGIPDRWFDNPRYRYLNGHISRVILICSEGPKDRCLECREPVRLTFPEDNEEI